MNLRFGFLILGMAAAFVWLPDDLLKFAALGGLVWLVVRHLPWRWSGIVVPGLASVAFGAAFLLNPLCTAPFLRIGGMHATVASIVWESIFIILGGLWLWASLASPPLRSQARLSSGGYAFLLWLLICVALHAHAWPNDVSYGGDEHFHMAAAQACGTLLRVFFGHTGAAALGLVWLAAGLTLCCARGDWTIEGGRWPRAWASGGLVVAAVAAAWASPRLVDIHPLVHEQAIRYPALQSWCSAAICSLTFANWGERLHSSFALLRFLPMLALFFLGWFVGRCDTKAAQRGTLATVLEIAALTTAPTLLYHGTMLYLELPVVALLFVVLVDGKRWLFARIGWLSRRPVWWAAIGLGFLKDTAIIAIASLWFARGCVQVLAWWKHRARKRQRRWPREVRLAMAVLGPGLLYLLLRSLHNRRPYLPHIENTVDLALWGKAVKSCLVQFGLLWIPAVAGVCRLILAKRGWSLGLAAWLFAALGAFHFLEDPQWIGFARFNLLLLPPVLLAAREGLRWVGGIGQRAALGASLLLLAGNMALSPVDFQGGRSDWFGSGERWYDFTKCLGDVRSESADCVVLLGNMSQPYALSQVTDRMGWRPRYSMTEPPPPGASGRAALEQTLDIAARRGTDYVIYRDDFDLGLAPEESLGTYQLVRAYPGRIGGLWLFRKVQRGGM